MRVAVGLLVAGLVVSVVLGYSGSARLADGANVLFVVTILTTVLLLTIALMFRRK